LRRPCFSCPQSSPPGLSRWSMVRWIAGTSPAMTKGREIVVVNRRVSQRRPLRDMALRSLALPIPMGRQRFVGQGPEQQRREDYGKAGGDQQLSAHARRYRRAGIGTTEQFLAGFVMARRADGQHGHEAEPPDDEDDGGDRPPLHGVSPCARTR